jgi:hypothetical protein
LQETHWRLTALDAVPICDVCVGGAPFPLQPDAFSCRVALNFNRPISQIASNQAIYENSVNAQGKIPLVFVFYSQLPRWITLRTVGKR